MEKGKITVFSGDGRGKTAAALGVALDAAAEGKTAVIIQFLKGKGLAESIFCKRMEPDIKIFRFEKSDVNFEDRTLDQRQDDVSCIRNSLGFARKVLATGECDLLILDEWLLYPLKETETRDLLEIIEARYQRSSTIFCSQFDVPGWHDKFSSPLIADAICDRIAHDSYRILIESTESMRKRNGVKS